jgi:hypothetical protein
MRTSRLGAFVGRVCVYYNDAPVLLAQFFSRSFPFIGVKCAWAPGGPVSYCETSEIQENAFRELRRDLRRKGFRILVSQPYGIRTGFAAGIPIPGRKPYRTFVIDLRQDTCTLEAALKKTFRYEKNRFFRDGGTIVLSNEDAACRTFAAMYADLAKRKHFSASGSMDLIRSILRSFEQGSSTDCAEARLLLAYEGKSPRAGASILRAGRTGLYLWGASAAGGPGYAAKAIQWRAMEWLKSKGVTIYDLGGVDPIRNRAVYDFKRRFGGQFVTMHPEYAMMV